MEIRDILNEAMRKKASDIIISAGAPVTYHVNGELDTEFPPHPLSPEESKALAYELMTDEQIKKFEQYPEMDLSFQVEGMARFRACLYKQRGAAAVVLRVVPLEIPHYSDIGISKRLLTQLVNIPNGLILVTGPTGSGKSTTLASLLQYMNTEYELPRHIVTIEDPIEFHLESKTCVIDQRELGVDTDSYVTGLKGALRQMAHIILVGEMRDRETIEVALTAAETGNLVMSTLATQSAAKTINRIIDVFPLNEQSEIRTRLALTLKAVLSQVLMRRKDTPGRVAAREVLFVNNSIANQIREGKVHQINNAIASSTNQGMVLMDDSLLALHHEGIVHTSDVLSRIIDPEKARHVLS